VGSTDRTQIKCRAAGFRLVCEVRDHELQMVVVAVGTLKSNAGSCQADQR
jgi:mRNA-degrading endonuclease RelE of RelBE toxin-antitoxin system